MFSSFGEHLKISLFGESHGSAIGVVLDGLKPGILLDLENIHRELEKRRPVDTLSTARREQDFFQIVSGYWNGYTTGTPLCIMIPNEDTKSSDYDPFLLRPSHADYTAYLKYQGFQDYRGGGHFSGRITAALVCAGAICKQILENKGIKIATHIKQIHQVMDDDFSIQIDELEQQIQELNCSSFAVLSKDSLKEMQEEIKKAKNMQDSVGGVLETIVLHLEGGIGEPFFSSIESVLSSLLFSIPAVKGVEFGLGFQFANLYGSEANDSFMYQDGIKTKTNHNGGINGGISNGMPILFKTVIKPTPTIGKLQETIDMKTNQEITMKGKGRHDPCIVHRARVVVDSVTAIGLVELLCSRYGYMWM